MGWVALAATVASSVISAAGAKQSADAQAASADYQSQVAANNKIISDTYAKQAIAAGDTQAQSSEMMTAQKLGAVRANAGASGIVSSSGSPARVQAGVAEVGAMDALTIRNNAMWRAYGYTAQGAGFDATSKLDTAQAGFAQTAGNIGVASSLLSGASSVGTKWSQYQQVGGWTSQG